MPVAPGGIATYAGAIAARLPELIPAYQHLHLHPHARPTALSPRASDVACWTPAHHRWERLTLTAELWRLNLALLHAPDFVAPLAGYRRLVVTVHDLSFLRRPHLLAPDARRHYSQTRRSVERADIVIVDAESVKRELIEHYRTPDSRIRVIPLGRHEHCHPPTASDAPDQLETWHLTPGYLLFVGTFDPRKNLPGLIAAYDALVQRRPDAPPLVLAGFGGLHSDLVRQLIATRGLTRRVHVLGPVHSADLAVLHRYAGVFVLLSLDEGFGLPLVDAMASGVPCVVANRGALPEVSGGAALLVEPDDYEGASHAIERALLDTTLARAMAARGLDQARAYSWDTTARLTADAYADAVSS